MSMDLKLHTTKKGTSELEELQNTKGKWGIGAKRSTAVDTIGHMEWRSFKERIIKGKLWLVKKKKSLGKVGQENIEVE